MQACQKDNEPRVLFVDDEKAILSSIRRFVRTQPWQVSFAESGEEAIELMKQGTFSVVVSDMRMPSMSGTELFKAAREIQPHAVRVLLSGYSDLNDVRDAVNEAGIFCYLTKPWDPDALIKTVGEAIEHHDEELRTEVMHSKTKEKSVTLGKLALVLDKKAKESDMEVEQAMTLVQTIHAQMQIRLKESVKVLNQIIDWKEGRDARHTRFVTHFAEKIARQLKLAEEDIDDIIISAMLHRVGMIGMPDRFCSEPYYRLSAEEKEEYDTYPVLGEGALAQANSLRTAAKIIRHHKEKVNGSGKPDALMLDQIPLGAMIIGLLSDYFELYIGRLEKNISGLESANSYILEWVGKKYDKKIADAFFEVLDPECEELNGSMLISSDKIKIGMVLEQNVYSQAGAILLSKGTEITESILEKITEFEKPGDEYLVCAPSDTDEGEK